MGGLKTLLAALVLAAPLAGPARADDGFLRQIASCAGRLSAQMEHQWLLSDPGADLTERRRDAFLDVLEAVRTPDRGTEILAWRIDAKMAQASLLRRGTFNGDAEDALWARRQADMILAGCGALILS